MIVCRVGLGGVENQFLIFHKLVIRFEMMNNINLKQIITNLEI